MEKILFVNDLIEWQTKTVSACITDESDQKPQTSERLIERVLWIDEGYILAFVFNIEAKKGFPHLRKISEILEALSTGIAIKTAKDPWARIIQDEHLTIKEKECRDKAWNIIAPIVVQEPSIYERHIRGPLVKEIVENNNAGKQKEKLIEKTVYGYLRRFWQRGKTPNALIPDYSNSSGKGQLKGAGNKKRGRPRKYRNDPDIGEGKNVTEQDRRIFRIAINTFYNTPKKNTLKNAYEQMVKVYYKEDIRYDENGVMKSILKPHDEIPTLEQFRYWYKVEHQSDVEKTIKSRKGSKNFSLNNRAILGTSKGETRGPGSRFQIDATIADVYLISQYNSNWIIGRPVIYVVIDVFSRMIAGIYVGLEGPSWLGAMMALANAAADKVNFCREYGIEITEEDWPVHHLPDAILGDRGELLGMPIENNFIPNLHIRVENAASYRADWKGLVERHFATFHGHIKPFVPGYIDVDFRQRGAKDYRLDGRLTVDAFTKIIIRIILFHNRHHNLTKYQRDAEMIADDVSTIPIELWKWGISNRSGKLKSFSEEIVKLNLMPTSKATITAKGIKLYGKELYYTCTKAEKEQWFERARSNLLTTSEKSLIVSYDIRKPDFIYLVSSDGREFKKCFLLDSEDRYSGKNFYDIEYMLSFEQRNNQKYDKKELQEKVDLIAEIESIVAESEKSTDAPIETLSNHQKVSNIRDNRAAEKSTRKETEGFEIDPITAQPGDGSSQEEESQLQVQEKLQSLQPSHLDLLRQKREEKKRGRNPSR
ncbi:MAG: DDE-type integrase/transposase/recombinase [Nodosilinea sp. WJT8-NPBG4]|jgi:hypothetical protein|nr:DDE-type integrase/transposase/recombinase [Nodosilinea sp. WJT8-NPBG4]